eukprot:XP_020399405.1 sulfated surface glycoprotein 185-like [Zea mays]
MARRGWGICGAGMQCALMAESRGRVRVDGGEQRGGRQRRLRSSLPPPRLPSTARYPRDPVHPAAVTHGLPPGCSALTAPYLPPPTPFISPPFIPPWPRQQRLPDSPSFIPPPARDPLPAQDLAPSPRSFPGCKDLTKASTVTPSPPLLPLRTGFPRLAVVAPVAAAVDVALAEVACRVLAGLSCCCRGG